MNLAFRVVTLLKFLRMIATIKICRGLLQVQISGVVWLPGCGKICFNLSIEPPASALEHILNHDAHQNSKTTMDCEYCGITPVFQFTSTQYCKRRFLEPTTEHQTLHNVKPICVLQPCHHAHFVGAVGPETADLLLSCTLADASYHHSLTPCRHCVGISI